MLSEPAARPNPGHPRRRTPMPSRTLRKLPCRRSQDLCPPSTNHFRRRSRAARDLLERGCRHGVHRDFETSRALKQFPSLDEIREELKRRDAKAKDSSEYGRGMTLVLDDEGKKYIRFLTWGQVWTSFTENNPGTVDTDGDLKENSLDIGLRRVRFLTYSQLSERYLILLHVGINNQTFTTGGDTGTREFGSDTRGSGPAAWARSRRSSSMMSGTSTPSSRSPRAATSAWRSAPAFITGTAFRGSPAPARSPT